MLFWLPRAAFDGLALPRVLEVRLGPALLLGNHFVQHYLIDAGCLQKWRITLRSMVILVTIDSA